MKPRTALLGAALLVVYVAITRAGWERYPQVWVDEGWIAEVAWSDARGGPLANPSHGPLHRYEDRLYWMPPLHFLVLSGVYRAGAPPLAGGRWVSLAAGALTLGLLVFWGRHLVGGPRGESSQPDSTSWWEWRFWLVWLALAFTLDPTLWKVHRTLRFESLTALWLVAATAAAWWGRPLLAGAAAGLAALTHPVGALAFPAAGGVLVARGRGPRAVLLAAGTGLACLVPWGGYLLGDRSAGFANVLGQNAPHLDGRNEIVFLQWLQEWKRWARYFAWPVLVLPLVFWVATLVRGVRSGAPAALLWILGVLAVGLASLPNKSEVYLTLLAPFLYLLAAWVGRRSGRPARIAAVIWLAVMGAADAALLVRDRACAYEPLRDGLAAAVPEGASVAGTFVTWFAFADRPYLEFHRRRAGDLADARPAFVVWGDTHLMDPFFERLRGELGPWLAAHADTQIVIASPCYGRVAVLAPRWSELDPALARGWERRQ